MAKPLTITIPWPAKQLDSNKRYHWRAKLKPKKEARQRAWAECVRQPGHAMRLVSVRVDVVAYHKTRNFRDRQNIISILKHSIDGIQDAEVIVDDSELSWGPVRREKDASNPRIEITLTPVGQE
ncbi:MAG: hypothetical protein ACIAXF_13860 [Phycisphaerales bacterium JB063]